MYLIILGITIILFMSCLLGYTQYKNEKILNHIKYIVKCRENELKEIKKINSRI